MTGLSRSSKQKPDQLSKFCSGNTRLIDFSISAHKQRSIVYVGIDPSVKATTVVCRQDHNIVFSSVANNLTEGGRGEFLFRLGRWLVDRMRLVEQACGDNGALMIVVEGYSYGSYGDSVFQIGEVGGLVRYVLSYHTLRLRTRIPVYVVEIPPTVLKIFATGFSLKTVAKRGGGVRRRWANKAEMKAAVLDRWGFDTDDDNVADAYTMSQFGEGCTILANQIFLSQSIPPLQSDYTLNYLTKNSLDRGCFV